MKLFAKTKIVLSLSLITSGLFFITEFELSRPDYANAAVPAPGPSQKKVIVKRLGMA